MKVDVLYWEGCPSYPEALQLVESVLSERHPGVAVTVVSVETEEEAMRLAFPGSPTVRVDGRDVDPDGAADRPSLSCRVYRLPDGRPSPIPSRAQIEEALA